MFLPICVFVKKFVKGCYMIELIFLENKRLFRDKKVLYYLIMISVFSSLMIPKLDSSYTIFNINDMTGYPDSIWIMSVVYTTGNFFMMFAAFFIFKGYIRKDLENQRSQEIYLASVHISKFIFTKFLSLLIVLTSSVFVSFFVIEILNLIINRTLSIDLYYLFNILLFIQIPYFICLAAIITIYEIIPLLSGSFGSVVYFLQSIIIMGNVFSSNAWDFTGLKSLLKAIETQFIGQSYEVSVFTNGSSKSYFNFNGINFSSILLGNQYLSVIIVTIILITAVTFFCKQFRSLEVCKEETDATLRKKTIDTEDNSYNSKTSQRIISINNQTLRLIMFELYMLFKSNKKTVFAFITLILISIAISGYHQKLSFLSVAPILFLGMLTDYKKRVLSKSSEEVSITLLGIDYHLIYSVVVFLIILIITLPILIVHLLSLNLVALIGAFLGLLILSSIIVALTYRLSNAYQGVYIVIWYICIFQKINFADILILNHSTNIYNQLVINIALLGAITLLTLISTSISTLWDNIIISLLKSPRRQYEN